MSAFRLILFDDGTARHWAPFTLTRPVGELLFGCMSLRERAERALGATCEGYLSRGALRSFDEPGAPPMLALDQVGTEGARVLLSSRAALPSSVPPLGGGPARLTVAGKAAGWVLPDGAPLPAAHELKRPAAAGGDGDALELGGTLLGRPWNLVEENAERIRDDVHELWGDGEDPQGAFRVGDGVVSLAEGAVVEPGVHLDTRAGPIRLDVDAYVDGPARLTGPLYVGRGSHVLGGSVGTSSIGPVCKVRGELAECVLLGWSNKAHDGHLGHALVGTWVNIGAYTTNSDLKNNYGSVKVWTPTGLMDTGLQKVGSFIGDHVKTGIGTVLNTGTVVGAGSSVFGGLMPPKVVPPFSWGGGPDLRDYRLGEFLKTADEVMKRRDMELTPGMREILRVAWHHTAGRRAET